MTRNHRKQWSSRASFLGFFNKNESVGRFFFCNPRKLVRDHRAIHAPLGVRWQALMATRHFADRAFQTDTGPFLRATLANKVAFIEVRGVGSQTLRPLEAKIDHGRLDHHAQVALRFEQGEHSLDGIELSFVLFNCKHIATSIEGALQVPTRAKACDNDSITGLGEPAQDALSKIGRLHTEVHDP